MKRALLLLLFLLLSCAQNQSSQTGRVNHVVLCWLKDSGNKEQAEKIILQSKKFTSIAGVLEVRVGEVLKSDRVIVDSSYDVALIMTFSSKEEMQAYLIHPDHVEAVNNVIKPLVSKILVYDFVEK
jgi:hypothetical protein